MKTLYIVVLISVLTASGIAANLPGSFKDALALADKQDKERDRATRIYDAVDLKDYYEKKYMPLFQSCFKSTGETSSFSFIAAIGADGHVLRLYNDHESKNFSCIRP